MAWLLSPFGQCQGGDIGLIKVFTFLTHFHFVCDWCQPPSLNTPPPSSHENQAIVTTH